MKILAIDPGSNTTGYAVIDMALNLLDAGLIRPDKTRLDAWTRIEQISAEVGRLIREYEPSRVILEVPGGQSGHGKRSTHSLIIYGAAVGAAYGVALAMGVPIVTADTGEWTRGRSKEARQAEVIARFPKYQPKRDPGLDTSDAIALGLWYTVGYVRSLSAKARK